MEDSETDGFDDIGSEDHYKRKHHLLTVLELGKLKQSLPPRRARPDTLSRMEL